MSSVAMTTSSVVPILQPMMMARPLSTVSRPLPSMLTTMKVIAEVLCMTAPVTKPQSRPAPSDLGPVGHCLPERLPVSFFRFSERRYIPAKKRPSPPIPWARIESISPLKAPFASAAKAAVSVPGHSLAVLS